MDNRQILTLMGLMVFAACGHARAQVPFFGGGSVAFDPEVSVISSGALLDAQATISADRKSVTLNMRPQLSRLQSLQRFPVSAIVNGGFVGGVNLPAGNAVQRNAPSDNPRRGGEIAEQAVPSPDEISRSAKAWVFTRPGMYLLVRLP